MKRLTVNVVSDSTYTVQGHGVHTAFEEHCRVLESMPDVRLWVNAHRASDIVHIHTVGPNGLAHLLLDKGARVVTTHLTPGVLLGSLAGARYWQGLARSYLKWFYNRADALFAVSDDVARELRAMGVRSRIHTLPNTIETEAFSASSEGHELARARLGIDPEAFVVLTVGQVQPRKGVYSFLHCAQNLPKYQFIWVGGTPFGPFSAAYSVMTKTMHSPPSNVTFTGMVNRYSIIDYYLAANLFFLPSLHETFGLVVVEAAAAGLPLLLTDLPQYREIFPGAYVGSNAEGFTRMIERFATDLEFQQRWKDAAAAIPLLYDSAAAPMHLQRLYMDVLDALRTQGKR